jgi:2-polyprenyl-3-methyl-5-hydroxy-6-metoxy-1,4-benzoquinol methylase
LNKTQLSVTSQTQHAPTSMRETLNMGSHCPICNSNRLTSVYDFSEFTVLKCLECGVSWRSNMYTKDTIVEMYCQESYDAHPFFAYDEQHFTDSERHKNFERSLTLIESLVPKGRLLDVACGSGTFLRVAEQRGWKGTGIELSPALCQQCSSNVQSEIINSSFEDAVVQDKYDAITFWDIIEHVLDPRLCVAKAASLLKPGGIVLFCTPNEQSLLANTARLLYKVSLSRYNYPALALHPRYHTFFFGQHAFGTFLRKNQLNVVQTYSQRAFFAHSPLANGLQKKAIGLIESVATLFDACYEFVVLARLEGGPDGRVPRSTVD